MPKFLLVEDSNLVIKILHHLLKDYPDLTCDVAQNAAEAKAIIEKNREDYYAALVDLNLPDAPNGEVVDYCIEQDIPTIVLTGNFDDEKRIEIQKKKVVDYIVKESRFSYEYAIKLVRRLHQNKSIRILVADDSSTSSKHIANLLKNQLFDVVVADDGDTALEMLQNDTSIKMLITDYNMPRMNGFDLVRQIRKQVEKNDLIIIGLSADGDSSLSAKFIKNGANDFLKKPFSHEEFHCRVLHNISIMESTQKMRFMAMHDYATNLPNKRYFYEQASEALEGAQKTNREAFTAILSIDKLEVLQDTYGIDTADNIMRNLSELFKSALSRFVYARLNDGEVATILTGVSFEQAQRLVSSLIEHVENHIVMLNGENVPITLSAGLVKAGAGSVMQSCSEADNLVYSAKQGGGAQLAV